MIGQSLVPVTGKERLEDAQRRDLQDGASQQLSCRMKVASLGVKRAEPAEWLCVSHPKATWLPLSRRPEAMAFP